MGLAVRAADVQFDGLVDEPARSVLTGRTAAIQFMNGTVVSDVELVAFLKDARSDAIRFLQYKDGRRTPKMKTSDVYRLVIEGRPYSFRYHRPSGGLFLIDLRQAQADAEARITGEDKTLREPQSEEEVKEGVANQIEIFNDARKKFAPVNLNLAESDFCLLLTDYPQPLAMQVAQQVDAMCEQMNVVFGLPKGANIWSGKIMVAVFSTREGFAKFESDVLNNNNFGTSTTIYHTNSRRFLVATHRDKLDKSVLGAISWSMAGGYVGRYRSSVALPTWIHAGLRGTLHRQLFPDPSADARAKRNVAEQLKRTGSLLNLLDATRLEDDRISIAKLLVIHLIEADPKAFSQFFEDVKLGHSWKDALLMNYGATPEAFASDFGRKMGVPNLRP